ncbi:MAG: N-acetylneuraminate synthase family protein [Patescibacteria group bacterium]
MARPIHLNGTDLTLGGDRVFLIAEIGKNFIVTEEDRPLSEYLANAKRLIDLATLSDADAVKFQTHEVEDEQLPVQIVSPHFKGKDRLSWVTRNTNATPFEGFWKPISEYAKEKGIIFFSTPMSRKAAQKINSLDLPLWKVGSGDVTDRVLLSYLKSTGKPVIISTGMISRAELDSVVSFFGAEYPLAILYCVSEYPAPAESFNLASLEYIKEQYPDITVGFSDHSIGFNNIALSALKLGATIIEKHFSFSRDLLGSDHKVSMTPPEFKELSEIIRSKKYMEVDTVPFYGDRNREFEGATNQFRPYFNKGLVAGRDIKKGEKITAEMVYAMRPRVALAGIPAEHVDIVIGRDAKADIKKYEAISADNIN